MTPTDYAATELALWEQALREQRDAEARLEQLPCDRKVTEHLELLNVLLALTTRADLLLAEAIKVKCKFRDQSPSVRRFKDKSST